MAIYAYMRVSTETQAQNNGTQSQRVAIDKFASDNNITISGYYEDLAISGTITDRPGLLDLLNILQENDSILVLNTSRLWREDTAKVIIRQEIIKAGADVISIEQPNYNIYTKDPNEFLINSMMELLDQYDRMAIAMKLSKGRRAKSKKGGKACGVAPYGYRWINADIETDEKAAGIIQDIFTAYENFKSLQKVADYCTTKGYKTQRNNAFSKMSLKKILNNDFYIGVVRYAGEATQGRHKAIISPEQYNRVQAILTRA